MTSPLFFLVGKLENKKVVGGKEQVKGSKRTLLSPLHVIYINVLWEGSGCYTLRKTLCLIATYSLNAYIVDTYTD